MWIAVYYSVVLLLLIALIKTIYSLLMASQGPLCVVILTSSFELTVFFHCASIVTILFRDVSFQEEQFLYMT